jgi:hypothetical protein
MMLFLFIDVSMYDIQLPVSDREHSITTLP